MSKSVYRVERVGTLWQVVGPNDEPATACVALKYRAEELAEMLDAAYRQGAVAALEQTRKLMEDPDRSVPEMLDGMGLSR